MKNQSRRKFLLFVGHLGLTSITGCISTCSTKKNSNPPMRNNMHLEQEIIQILEAGKKIKLKWDCGNDQAIVTIFIDEKKLAYDSPILIGLDMYLINYLNLPTVGELELVGEGEIIDENDQLYLECESILVGFEDYSDNGNSNGWKVVNKKEEMYSGKREIFPPETF